MIPTYAEEWGIEAYSVDGEANINRVYFTGNRWSTDKADMVKFIEAESIVLKETFERQGLHIEMHQLTQNNPPINAMSLMPTRNSELWLEMEGRLP